MRSFAADQSAKSAPNFSKGERGLTAHRNAFLHRKRIMTHSGCFLRRVFAARMTAADEWFSFRPANSARSQSFS
jgi:hypothetical protein